ncbi:hypothetical protein SAMN05444148_1422 [Winogradskyella jejuensis]|uniref:Uncharacterized protein n=1 Tax=Winogradskyella jejuensis TaxID=1089305 RepID=A0A1M5PBF5_9FLAO|nr:hypothetical protein SAMN05444148_1422 [Winogradskyella jejuensis]
MIWVHYFSNIRIQKRKYFDSTLVELNFISTFVEVNLKI